MIKMKKEFDEREERFRRRLISRKILRKIFKSYGLEVSQDEK